MQRGIGEPPRIDDALMARVAAGDDAARHALYEGTRCAVFGFALSITRHAQDAQDVMQETYLRAFEASARYRAMGKPLAWLLTIARNLAAQKLRERAKQSLTEPPDLPADAPGVTLEDRLVLAAALTRLGDDERQIVTLHATAGFKHREIAKLLALPLSTVLSKYNRAIRKMRAALKEMNGTC